MNRIKTIAEAIKNAGSFLITAHESPCGDAIASELALASIIGRMGKKTRIYNSEPVPANLSFLPGTERVNLFPAGNSLPEAAIVLDCANPGRIGKHASILKNFELVINIDHHVSNEVFGTLNYVDPDAASTGEQVFALSKYLVDDITPGEALCLYTTLAMDTGFFRYSNTSARTFNLAGEFAEKGADPELVADQICGNFTLAGRKLLGAALAGVRPACGGKIVYITVTRKMMEECGAIDGDANDFIDYVQSVEDSLISFCLRELPGGVIRANFRSKTLDVNEIASEFGGGGHRRAAGCAFRGKSLGSARDELIETIQKFLPDGPESGSRD